MKAFVFLFLAILFIASSRTFYKLAADSQQLKTLFFIIGISLGFLHAIFYTKSVSLIDLSVANVVFIAGSLICVEVVAITLFKEPISLQKFTGLVLVLAGLIVTSIPLKLIAMRTIFILSTIFFLLSALVPLIKFVFMGNNSMRVDFPIPHHYPIEADENKNEDIN